ncbi:MAG: hypothetical protein FWE57_05155 [Chitinispirillia bacterium]|nr:hypothetical protein [Chitinispirillia bacterium]
MILERRSESGSTLATVLFFASAGLIVLTMYLAHQTRSSVKALQSPAALQALLNARSGIYRALEMLAEGFDESDTLKTISAIDDLFRMDMFDDADAIVYDESMSMNNPKTISLYAGDDINRSEITFNVQGIYNLITSTSTVNKIIRTVEALQGSAAPAKPDTVLILENNLPIKGRFRGIVHRISKIVVDDTLSSKNNENNVSSDKRIKMFLSELKNENIVYEDTSAFDIPLIIQTYRAIESIPDTVKGHLMLDGAFSEVVWRERRQIVVYGDLQITGSFKLENLELRTGGEIRILDKASLVNVSLFSMSRIFIGDNAVFQGNALSMGSINVYGKAEIRDRSSLIAVGTGTSEHQKKPSGYSIFLSESSVFDGTAIALDNPGGIKTDPDVKLSGILWAQKAVCHSGKLSGLIKAQWIFDCSDIGSDSLVDFSKLKENSFSGALEPLSSIGNYKMPYFMGTPQIISWREF